MRQYTNTEKEGDAGHAHVETGDMRETSMKITEKIRKNILSGRWPAETRAEIEMLREHREKLKKKKSKKKL